MAAVGARAAAGDAGDRVSQGHVGHIVGRPLAAFRRGLNEAGYAEGQNVAIEYRWAENQCDRLQALAADLVRRQCAVIVAGGDAVALAAKAATTTIPIVFASGEDPVKLGLVASLNRPGGNLTGICFWNSADLQPSNWSSCARWCRGRRDGLLVNPTQAATESQKKTRKRRRAPLAQILVGTPAANAISMRPSRASRASGSMRFVVGAALFNGRRNQLVPLATRHAIARKQSLRDTVAVGGLVSYSASHTDAYRQVGVYTGRVLKGARPADLPVVQSIKFELVINPQDGQDARPDRAGKLLAATDEVIE